MTGQTHSRTPDGYKDSVGTVTNGGNQRREVVSEHSPNVSDRPKDLGPRGREGYVYFVQEWANPESAIKIGFSGDVLERIRQLSYQNDLELDLLAWLPATLSVERDLHKRFSSSRIRGEWFEPTQELLDVIELIRVLHNEEAA